MEQLTTVQPNIYGARVMEPRFGFDVYKTSIRLYERHPLHLFLLGLAFLLFNFFSNVAPVLLQLILAFVAPMIGIGLLRTLRLMDTLSEKINMKQISDVFFDPTRKDDYFFLGTINVGYFCLILVLGLAGGIGGVLSAVATIIYLAACFFAYPLMEFDRVKPIEAFKASLQISKLNWKPAVIYFFSTIVFMILSLLAFGVGFLIFMPLTFITRYVAYQIVLNK